MEYLNDRTYARGEDVTIRVMVDAEKAKTEDGVVYESTYTLLHGTSRHFDIKFWGGAPKIEGDKAIITLSGKVEGVADDVYRARGGVLGRVPGDTVKHSAFVV